MFEPAGHRRARTATSAFGVGRRENHDSSGFYARFTAPDLSDDDDVSSADRAIDRIFCADARSMPDVPSNSVALVVTSPPYFAGKEYEEALGEGHVPATYLDYPEMLEDVFAECAQKLEPGGCIAVNVANLGRRPYRSLSADVTHIGRFDRALTVTHRQHRGLPYRWSLLSDDFMEFTTDLWEIPPESATRVGHPAPFPVELPDRLIHLYTHKGDLVLDPFMGSGTTAVAAVRNERHFAGCETDAGYVVQAEERVAFERTQDRDKPSPSIFLGCPISTTATKTSRPVRCARGRRPNGSPRRSSSGAASIASIRRSGSSRESR